MPIARKIPKPAGRFWLCSAIRTKYDNTINRHYPAWFPHCYYLTFSSLCHCAIYVIARTPQHHFPTLSPFSHCPTGSGNPPLYVLFFRCPGRAWVWQQQRPLLSCLCHFLTFSPFCHCPTWSGNPPRYVLFFRYSGQAGVWQQQRPLLSCLCHCPTFSPFCHCPAWPDNPLFSISFFGILRLCVRNI